MIEIAFAAFLLGKFLFLHICAHQSFNQKRTHLVKVLLLHIVIFLVATCFAIAYLIFKSGHMLHWPWLFEYQRLFYGIGFMMMPLPLQPHPWMPVLGTYLIGMMVSAASWTRNPAAKRADLIFFISFLGLGLFLYYEGRSHILNLITVSWPALILAAILSDRVVRFVRAGALSALHLCLPAVALALFIFCGIPIVKNVGRLWADVSENYRTRELASDALVSDELAFIRAHSTRGERCIILSKRQGLYYMATGLVSPLVGPGYAELLTMHDREELLRQLASKKFDCVFLGLGDDSAVELGINPLTILPGYAVTAASSRGSMVFLRPPL
jgi:hypothetical protein